MFIYVNNLLLPLLKQYKWKVKRGEGAETLQQLQFPHRGTNKGYSYSYSSHSFCVIYGPLCVLPCMQSMQGKILTVVAVSSLIMSFYANWIQRKASVKIPLKCKGRILGEPVQYSTYSRLKHRQAV